MIYKVARLGNPALRAPARAVGREELGTEPFERFLDDMVETMREYQGVGLAATQVHVAKRVAVIEVRTTHPRYPEAPEIPLTVLVNPEIVERSPELADGWEGCLSIPDLRGRVPRSRRLRVKALDRAGKPLELAAEDFLARVIQHEYDHLDGGVYLDRMPDLKSLSFLSEFSRYCRESS